jgi:hypothetical protein
MAGTHARLEQMTTIAKPLQLIIRVRKKQHRRDLRPVTTGPYLALKCVTLMFNRAYLAGFFNLILLML